MINLIIFIVQSSNLIISFVLASGVSTIKVGDRLDLNSQLVSTDRRFTLGFFAIPETGSTYLGIWYTHDRSSTKVWVANRSTPIKSSSCVLMIDHRTGKLIISNGGITLVTISDNQSGASPNLTATLQDTGDFQLKNEFDNQILWKSFDYPSNVLLPGMKLGWDRGTGHSWELTSWLSDTIPDLGAFTMTFDAYGETYRNILIRRRGLPYWSKNVKKLISVRYNLSYVYDNDDSFYFSYHEERYCSSCTPMWILNVNGQVEDGETDGLFIGSSDFCYGNHQDDGCLAANMRFCRDGDDKFTLLNGDYTWGTHVFTPDNDSSVGFSDCMIRCWDDCDCVAFNTSENGVGCNIWLGSKDLKFSIYPKSIYAPKYVLLPPSNGNAKILIWGSVVSGIFLLSFCFGLLLYRKNKKFTRKEKREKDEDRHLLELMDMSDPERGRRKGIDIVVFSFADILSATNDFSSENKLGQGGFGPVYKGKLSDEQEIAIKRLSRTSGQGLMEFKNELMLIAKLQHTNLVRVLGCCIHGEEKMLIYEYMPNKSLDFFLFDETRKALLDWPKRCNIIEGISQGLLYLHKYSRMRIIHRDLKPSNVLLDQSMNPKISDFGLARIFKQNETEAMTERPVGTYGYMSPEYAMDGTFSVKSDVFSFGVLMLEIVSGRRNVCLSFLNTTINLIGYAWELWQQGNALQLQDPTLVDACVEHQLLRTIHVALLCVQEYAGDRPVISEVISMLANDTMLLPVPKQPGFFFGGTMSKSTFFERKPYGSSGNNSTVTQMESS
ncbi:hypothetical protein E3N88_08421 [Mikania micrantha]|uniref:Receptor-like serine/threonine-protein kinase n=1 Tax=Mikania micrantha TaxID=192012 RepID=A0A5N6PJ92_9ASTR|nr:hypothetical protein E3N88_08421 [Mikania micrantha]